MAPKKAPLKRPAAASEVAEDDEGEGLPVLRRPAAQADATLKARPAAAAKAAVLKRPAAVWESQEEWLEDAQEAEDVQQVPSKKPARRELAPGEQLLKRPAAPQLPAATRSSSSSARPSATFRDLLDLFAIDSVYKQLHLADLVGDERCTFDSWGARKGILSYGEDLAFRGEVLGAECFDAARGSIFVWGWVPRGPVSGTAPALLRSAQVLRTGEGWSIGPPPQEFTQGVVPKATASAQQLGAVACGVLGAAAYQLLPPGPDGIARLLLITDPDFPPRAPETAGDALRVSTAIQQALALGWLRSDMDAIDAFMRGRGWEIYDQGDARRYTLKGGASYRMAFDKRSRLKEMETSLMPA